MKVAYVLSHVATRFAGVPIATRRLGSSLSLMGVEISFWATGDSYEEQELASEGIPAHLYENIWPKGWRRSSHLARELSEAADKIDIFHIHEIWTYPQYKAAKIARSKGIPYIVAPRASLEPWRLRYKGFKKKIYLSLIGNQLLHSAVCLHAVAPAEVDGFRKVGYHGPVFIINNGIVPEEFFELPDPVEAEERWTQLRGCRVVLFLSRLSPEKGIDQLIPAWADIVKRDSYSDALLVLAGPDDRGYRITIEEIIKTYGLENRVLLTGMVEGRDKLALMRRADIYTLPSYSEGFSNSVLESLAVGTPVLITPGCNFPEVVDVGAGICTAPERIAIGDALRSLLDVSREQLREMGAKGRKLVLENYTCEISARKMITVYNAILKGKEIPLNPQPAPLDASGRALII